MKAKKVNEKQINLGYIAMYRWNENSRLFSDWFYEQKDPKYKKEIEETIPDEIILPPNKEYNLIIDYPLSTKFETTVKTGNKGLTRRQVVDLIVKCYKFIYSEEDATTKIPVGLIPGMLNRNITNGDYGIWGHELSDLMLHTLYINDSNLTIEVDS